MPLFYDISRCLTDKYFDIVWGCHSPGTRGGVEDTRLEAKAKDTKKIRGQGQPFRGQTLLRPRTGMLEAKDQGHKAQVLSKKKKSLHKNFSGDLQKKKKKKVFTKIFQAISKKKKKVFTKIFQAVFTKQRFPKNFSTAPQNFNIPKNCAVLEPRTGQFSRPRPRTSKTVPEDVLEAKDVLEDSTSARDPPNGPLKNTIF